jgi:hypothetical protein
MVDLTPQVGGQEKDFAGPPYIIELSGNKDFHGLSGCFYWS